MSNKKKALLLSVVIPHRENEGIEKTLAALDHAAAQARDAGEAAAACYELLSVSGNQPSVQRNSAVREAQGKYIYFLDNDSLPAEDCFIRIARFFAEHPDAAFYGGPSLTPVEDSSWQQAFGAVLGSFWGSAFMRARYRSFGKLRPANDRSLILCNLAARRDVFTELGGFNERLYPNEENALMDDARRAGYSLWHDPGLIVYRSQRPNPAAFIRQLFGYGRGRGEQMRLAPLIGNIIPFVFMLFPPVVLCIPLFLALIPYSGYILLVYPVCIFFAALMALRKGIPAAGYTWISFFLCHFSYGMGLWVGLFAPLRSRKVTPRAVLKRQERGTR
ncbi:MAG: glycosyltransferase [Spirochaetota bacterium]|jgi:glycosyltransferase involved in cell wall biosynthesis|nr:glycosyltransferase [Spirochaetota bacterium]